MYPLSTVSPDRSKNTDGPEDDAAGFREAAARFFPDGHRLLEVSGTSSGYSGSAFARVDAAGRAWLLRRWPRGFDEGRLRLFHRALAESRSRGFCGVPALAPNRAGETSVRISDRLYEAQGLLGGEPLAAPARGRGSVPNVACSAPLAAIAAQAQALARFHLSTSGLPREPGHWAPPLLERLRGLGDEVAMRREPLRHKLQTLRAGDERRTALRWLALLPHALGAALEAAERVPPGTTSEVLCHADLWPEHVFFEGDRFTGFADFESLAFASPALDLAQLVGHFGGWENADAVLRSYRVVAPLGEGDGASLAPEAVADLVAEGLWALGELYGEPSDVDPFQGTAHRTNLELLLGSLEEAAEACARTR